tara:strand:+ start:781 stop:1029 length:249 start_codon:yes stop_codon:yes gene_type:complete
MGKERDLTKQEIKEHNRKNKNKIKGGTTSTEDGLEFIFVDPDEEGTKKAKKLEKQAVDLLSGGGSVRGTQGQTSGKNFSGIY